MLADGVRQTRARKRRAIGLEHERLVGRALRRFDKLAEELVDAALVLDEVLSDDAASSLGIRPLDAAIHLANVLEVLWRRVLEALPAMPEARWLPLNDRMALGARVAAAVKELGFVLPEDPQALEQVTRVKGNLIGKAIQRRSGSAGAAIATALLAGVNESGGALVKRLAVADPELIASCCTVLKARGHGDTSDLAAQEVQTLYQRTLALTRTMIDVLEPTARDHDREEHHV